MIQVFRNIYRDIMGDVYDEQNETMVLETCEKIAGYIPSVFKRTVNSSKDQLRLEFSVGHKISEENLLMCLDILAANLNSFYTKLHGKNWRTDKIEEMQELGLIYVYYFDDKDNIVAFLSFMLTVDEGLKVLYLYEIHVSPGYQGEKIGTSMLDDFHELSGFLCKQEQGLMKNIGTCLTVFSDNSKALGWYKSKNYMYAPHSERDRKLRNGKVIKPDVYVMFRRIGGL